MEILKLRTLELRNFGNFVLENFVTDLPSPVIDKRVLSLEHSFTRILSAPKLLGSRLRAGGVPGPGVVVERVIEVR